MEMPPNWVTCDGCGLPASPEHVAERLARLELATRYRPIHTSVLFLAVAPQGPPQDDFYAPPKSENIFQPFLDALDILRPENAPAGAIDLSSANMARLVEFQRRGYYLTYLSECPLAAEDDTVAAAISRLGPTLLRRIRFNYRPKRIVILDLNLGPLREVLENAGVPGNSASILEIPNIGDVAAAAHFKAAMESLAGSASG